VSSESVPTPFESDYNEAFGLEHHSSRDIGQLERDRDNSASKKSGSSGSLSSILKTFQRSVNCERKDRSVRF